MKRYYLEYPRGLLQKTFFAVDRDTTFGRSADNTIHLPDPSVSRRHANLIREGGQWILADLRSRNGVFVNDERVQSRALAHGDKIRLGVVHLRFLEVDVADRVRSVKETDDEPALDRAAAEVALPSGIPQEIQDHMDLVRTFLDALPHGAVIINDRMEVLYRNTVPAPFGQAAYKSEGSSLGSALGCTDSEGRVLHCGISPECTRCLVGRWVRRAFARGTSIRNAEMSRPKKKGGTLVYVRLSVTPLPYSLTGERLALVVWEDITHPTRAKKALQSSEDRYRSLVENMSETVFTMDREGHFTFGNSRAEALTGHPLPRLLQMTYQEIVAPEYLPILEERIASVLAGRAIEFTEIEILRAMGGRLFVEVSGAPLLDETGAIVGVQGIARDVTERKAIEERIRQLAYHDPLTGLPNRLLFRDRLNLAMAHAQRNDQGLTVMFLDLDHFKEINDALGHNVGDQLLKVVANRLARLLRKEDTVARMGGDEFLLLLPGTVRTEDASTVARKIIEGFSRPFSVEARELGITTSIGIAIYPEDGQDADTLMKNADAAMYRAKEKGRNNFQSCTPSGAAGC